MFPYVEFLYNIIRTFVSNVEIVYVSTELQYTLQTILTQEYIFIWVGMKNWLDVRASTEMNLRTFV